MKPESAVKRRQPSEMRIALIGGLLVAIGPVSLALFTPAMPEIARWFGVDTGMVQLALSFYFAGFAAAQLVCGPLSDAMGRRPVLIGFTTIYVLGCVGTLAAPEIWSMLATRFLQGMGAAAGMALSRAIVRDMFEGDKTARILNLISLVLAAGPSVAPVFGGILMLWFGWQSIFVVMAAIGLAALMLIWFSLPETLPAGSSEARLGQAFRSYGSLLRDARFFWPSLTLGGVVGTFYTQAAVLPFIIVNGLGYSGIEFGLIMLFISGSYFVTAALMNWLIPRYGAYRLVPLGLAMLGASGLMMIALPLMPGSLAAVVVPVTLFTAGNAFILPAMYTASLEPFPNSAGAASSMTGFMQMGIGFLGTSMAGLFPDAALALAVIVPTMASLAIFSWWRWYQQSISTAA